MSSEDTIEIMISQNKTYVDPIPLINFDNECKQIEEKLKHDKEDGNFDKTTTIEVSSELDDENIKKVVKYFIRGTDIVKQTRRVKVTKKHNKVMLVTEESIENSFTLGLAARIQKNCFEYLDAPIEIVGSVDTPAIPLNSILEETLLPNGDKVAAALKGLLDY